MPVVIHWIANFMLGLATARVVRGAPALHRPGRAPWPLLFLGVLQAVIITPCVTYLFRYWPSWSLFYLCDPATAPNLEVFVGMLSALVVAVNFALVWLGFTCGYRSVRRSEQRWLHVPVALGCAMASLCAIYLGDRIIYVGDYETFWQGEAPLLVYTPAGWVALAAGAAAVAFLSVLHKRFRGRDPVFI